MTLKINSVYFLRALRCSRRCSYRFTSCGTLSCRLAKQSRPPRRIASLAMISLYRMKKNVYVVQAELLWEAGTEYLGEFAKLRKATTSLVISVRPSFTPSVCLSVCRLSVCLSVCPSVRLHETTQLPLDGFSWNSIFENLSKISREKIKLYWTRTRITGTLLKNNLYYSSYLAQIFVEWEIFKKNIQKITTHISCSTTLFFR